MALAKPWRIKHKIMAFNRNESLINTGELGKAIKRRREELKLSLRDVADVTDVSASTLSRIENGTGRPDADNIARLTQWLDMPVDRLMTKHTDDTIDPVIYYPHEPTTDIYTEDEYREQMELLENGDVNESETIERIRKSG